MRRRQGFAVRFGDAEDPHAGETLPLADARWVVSTLPQTDVNLALLEGLKRQGYAGTVAMVAHAEEDLHALRHAGATRVLMPFRDAADHAADTIFQDIR
jgi:Trk K+ transport system NAD-binding subunit